MSKNFNLEIHGAGQDIGRSCFVLNAENERFLMDYGVKFTPEGTEYPLPIEGKLTTSILSHAHMDHSGFVPELYVRNPAPMYMTAPTMELSKMLWADALKIATMEELTPPFSPADIERTEKSTYSMKYNAPVDISKNARLEFVDAGHILGASMVKLDIKEKTFVYTGDYMLPKTRLHDGADIKSLGKVDYLLMESTYGNRVHPDRDKVEHDFIQLIRETLDRGGHAVVAAFAVGRTQELLDVLFDHGMDAPVFLDGMSRKATQIYQQFPQFNSKPKVVNRMLEQLNIVTHPGIRKQALKEPSVIVTTAGMLEGGPVMHYLNHLHADERSSLLLTGFQVPETKGRKLLETGRIELDSGPVEPKMTIQRFDFSAHSGKDALLKTIDTLAPEQIVLIHGDQKISTQFREELQQQGFKVSNPATGQTVELMG